MDRKGSGWLLEDQFHGDRDLALLWGVRDTAAARRVYWTSTRGINSMKHLLTGVGMVAALALSAATWAQPTSPGGNAVGMPGPNPGGPGLTPYTTGPGQAPPPYMPPPPATMAPAASMPPSAAYQSPSSAPPTYPSQRQTRSYNRTGTRPGGYSADHSANQLNHAELSRLQEGSYSNFPAPSYPPPPPPYGAPHPYGPYPYGAYPYAPYPYRP